MSTSPDWTRYLRHLGGCSIFELDGRCDCGMLLAEGREMDRVHELKQALRKIGNYCAAHDDVIDASWVAKVINESLGGE